MSQLPPMDRRTLVASAAASAAVGLGGSLVHVPAASAADAEAQGFYKAKIGDLEITTVYDGINLKPHDAGFIRNASIEDTKEALRKAGVRDDVVPITFSVTFVTINGRTIMFDSGTGAQLAPTAGLLATNMKKAGIDPASIKTIIVTHFHGDHIFGLMAKDTNAQTYPDAEIIVPAEELAFWNDPGFFTRTPAGMHAAARRIQATLGTWKNVTPKPSGSEFAPGIRSIPAFGHTPGHTAFAIGSGPQTYMNLADITNIPALFARNPGWHVVFDADPVQAEASRRRLFDQAIAEAALVSGYHFGMPGLGRMVKDGNGYAFVAGA